MTVQKSNIHLPIIPGASISPTAVYTIDTSCSSEQAWGYRFFGISASGNAGAMLCPRACDCILLVPVASPSGVWGLRAARPARMPDTMVACRFRPDLRFPFHDFQGDGLWTALDALPGVPGTCFAVPTPPLRPVGGDAGSG